jgi:hypothetical protein
VLDQMAGSPLLNPSAAPEVGGRAVEDLFDEPPEQVIVPAAEEKPWLSRRGRRLDFAQRDAQNRHLGQLGE